MKVLKTEVLVIGGGATGAGVAWDAALRGLQVILVEKRDLTHGTSGRFHGLLHSGARYAVTDPESAAECILENRTLRKTHTHCIEDTGGFFVVTPEDEGDYPDRFKAACGAAGIPCSEIPLNAAFHREPLLNRRISRVFEVPDASVDSFLAAHATAQAARQAGARLLTYHEVVGLILTGGADQRRVGGARVAEAATGAELEIHAEVTVNATGAWAGQIARMAGFEVFVVPNKGTMAALNHRLVNTVINRCKVPGNADILVPSHTVCVIGTTSAETSGPETPGIEPREVNSLIEEGAKMLPDLKKVRFLRAWAGVRPLFRQGTGQGTGREISRRITLLDHKEREGLAGFLTITGGKWTTFRKMAEMTVDRVCDHLGRHRPCQTASVAVPGAERRYHSLGHRLSEVETNQLQGELVCECELVTRKMIENAAVRNPTLTLDDLRRDLRLGMGPCQGTFCTYRAVGIMHELQKTGVWRAPVDNTSSRWECSDLQSPGRNLKRDTLFAPGLPATAQNVAEPNLLLRDFLQERWRGMIPVLWGHQLQQARLDQMVYLDLVNIGGLPGQDITGPGTGSSGRLSTPTEEKEADRQ